VHNDNGGIDLSNATEVRGRFPVDRDTGRTWRPSARRMLINRTAKAQGRRARRGCATVDLGKLPQLEGWMAGGDFDPRTFILSTVTVAEAAATSLLFWPDFIEYRGCVFLKFVFDEGAVENWFNELNGDGKTVESVANHVHLWDVFAAKTDAENGVLAQLASRLSEMWNAALRLAFPDRQFVVTVSSEADDYGPTVSFRSA